MQVVEHVISQASPWRQAAMGLPPGSPCHGWQPILISCLVRVAIAHFSGQVQAAEAETAVGACRSAACTGQTGWRWRDEPAVHGSSAKTRTLWRGRGGRRRPAGRRGRWDCADYRMARPPAAGAQGGDQARALFRRHRHGHAAPIAGDKGARACRHHRPARPAQHHQRRQHVRHHGPGQRQPSRGAAASARIGGHLLDQASADSHAAPVPPPRAGRR